MSWGVLFIAALFEIGFTTAMKLSHSGRGWWAEVLFIVCVIGSFALLQHATKTIPIGIAYAVWTGIGAVGTLLVSQLFFAEPINRVQLAFTGLLIVSVAGLKLSSSQ